MIVAVRRLAEQSSRTSDLGVEYSKPTPQCYPNVSRPAPRSHPHPSPSDQLGRSILGYPILLIPYSGEIGRNLVPIKRSDFKFGDGRLEADFLYPVSVNGQTQSTIRDLPFMGE